MKKYDILIIGGGPAGSACARRLREGGAVALILDQHPFPRQKPCAGWITPSVVNDLGLDLAGYPHGLTTFPALHFSFGKIPLIRPGRQYAIRRYEFDEWLLARSGADFEVHRVKNITATDEGFQVDGKYSAKYLVGAGGTHCPVYRALFAPVTARDDGARIVAMEEEFPYPWEDGRCRLWFFENGLPGYAWYVPKAEGYVNVGVGGSVEKLTAKGESIKTHWQYLIEKLEKLNLVQGHVYQPLSHVYYLNRNLPEVRRGNAFLVGDAAGLATLDMGEGIGPAIKSGTLAADAILNEREYRLDSISKLSFLPRFLTADL